ncbi:transcriptional regulator [Eubacterium minutum ATCC 700079]|nr:transcriptional regulator [Eubacterium minutum ATCC 700079]
MGRHGTIAGRKAAQDSKRSALFTKYAKTITVAAKDGGDPEYNSSLRVAIEKAKGIGMPNDNINRAIKKGTGELGGSSYDELKFEGYGAGGVAIIVDCLTDNTNRTTSAVRSLFDKHGGNLGTPGCVSYMFARKGVILIEKSEETEEDSLMDTALEAGAEDMVIHEDSFEIITDPTDYHAVDDALRKQGYELVESEITYVPSVESRPEDEDLKKLKKLVDMLEDNDDVQTVNTNCSVDLEEV